MIEPKYSTFWPRFSAGFVDALIFWPVGWLLSLAFSYSESVLLRVLVYIVSSGIFLVYSIWMHGKFGQTLGKMAYKVIVLSWCDQNRTGLCDQNRTECAVKSGIMLLKGLIHCIPREGAHD